MKIEILQNDSSVDYQRKLVAETLPELEQFIIIGRGNKGSEKHRNFASCSFPELDLANAIANFLIGYPEAIKPFVLGVNYACGYIAHIAKDNGAG